MDRSARREIARLRGMLRAEGRDPYPPAAPFVSVVARYQDSKRPRLTADQITALFNSVKYKFKNWQRTETRKTRATSKMREQRAEQVAKILQDTARYADR